MKPAKVLLSLVFCFLLILTDINYKSSEILRAYGKDMLTPVIYIAKTPVFIFNTVIDFFNTRQDLRLTINALEQENLKLKSINSLMNEISFENRRLNSLEDSIEDNPDDYYLVKKKFLSTNDLKPVMTVSVNSREEVFAKNNAVLSEKGLLGRIVSQGLLNAEVMLVQDSRSLVPVVSSTSRLHAILQGSGLSRFGHLNNIKKSAEYKIGEELYSSGLGGVYPSGYPVAKIKAIKDNPDNEFLDIQVAFLQSPVDQDYFLVKKNIQADE
ncbi:rod shape-determining protein MreC [Gammaproteobacteria bacterium]|nr:rod shape-determining protein MreC [Gammaproteobacteria bacterium]